MSRYAVSLQCSDGLSDSIGHAATLEAAKSMCVGPMVQTGTEEWVGPILPGGGRFTIGDNEAARQRLKSTDKEGL